VPELPEVEAVRRRLAPVLTRARIADRFLMVGNALRSDVLPVVEAGGWAVHIPAALSWSHEHTDVPAHATRRYVEVAALAQLPDAIETIERTMMDFARDAL
jgi:putative hydrolase of the HAD superfamily